MSNFVPFAPGFQAFDENNVPLAYGWIYPYKSGTWIPVPTVVQGNGWYDNDWPLQLDYKGRANYGWYIDDQYLPLRINLKSDLNVQQPCYPIDNWDSKAAYDGRFYWDIQPIDVTVSSGDTITVTAHATADYDGIIYYQWYQDGYEYLGQTTNILTISNASTYDSGSYYCKAWIDSTDQHPYVWIDTINVNIKVNQLPFPLTLLGIGIWNEEGDPWTEAPFGTNNWPGPYGLNDPTRYFDKYKNILYGQENGVYFKPDSASCNIKPETVYLRQENTGDIMGSGQLSTDAFWTTGIYNGNMVPGSADIITQAYSDYYLYMLFDPDHSAGSGGYIDYNMRLTDGITTIDIPLRHVLPGW